MAFRHAGPPTRLYQVTFVNGVKIRVRALSKDEARTLAKKEYKDSWRTSFHSEAASVAVKSVADKGQ